MVWKDKKHTSSQNYSPLGPKKKIRDSSKRHIAQIFESCRKCLFTCNLLKSIQTKKALTNLSGTNFWSSWGLPILLTHARTTLHADKEESHFYAFSSLDHFFHWVRYKFFEDLKYIQNKYSTVYLKRYTFGTL